MFVATAQKTKRRLQPTHHLRIRKYQHVDTTCCRAMPVLASARQSICPRGLWRPRPRKWRVCKMHVPAICGSRGSWPSFPSGEYSFGRLLLIQWRLPDLLVFLQLHYTVLSLSRQDLLISLVFLLLLTLLDILSFNRAVHHSFTLHFFLLLHTRCKHIPSINSFEPWRSSH
jgi:hypothetical protein